MGKEDRKKTKVASAARAGQLLGNGQSSTPAGLGFGGYMGAQSLGARTASGEASPSTENAADLDPEIALHLRRLSKREAVTKQKALQALKELIMHINAREAEQILPSWTQLYQRLAMDNSKLVREGAVSVLGSLSKLAGRGVVPFLKHLVGPWLMARHDLQSEVANSAKLGLAAMFPDKKLEEAFYLYSEQLTEYFSNNLKAAPEALGDPQREAAEDIQERYERVIASTFLSLSALLILYSKDADTTRKAASVAAICTQPGFWKKFLGSKSATIRRHAYVFVSTASKRTPSVLEASLTDAAQSILGCLADKEPENHSAMWGMILAFSKALPASWEAIDARKAVMPKLLAFFRSGCYGSAESSYDALLPLLTLLPPFLGKNTELMAELLSAVLSGWTALLSAGPSASSKAKQSAAACYTECWFYTLAKVQQSEDSAKAVNLLANNLLSEKLLPQCLTSSEGSSKAARKLLVATTIFPSSAGSGLTSQTQEILISNLREGLTSFLQSGKEQPPEAFNHLELLILEMDEVPQEERHNVIIDNIAKPVIATLLERSQTGGALSTKAASCLAGLIRRFGSPKQEGEGLEELEAVRKVFHNLQPSDSPCSSQADILLACILNTPSPSQSFVQSLDPLILKNKDRPEEGLEQMQVLLDRSLALANLGEDEAMMRRWQSQNLNNLAYKLVAILFGDGAWSLTAGQVLGSLIKGDGAESFLTAEAIEKVLSILQGSISSNDVRKPDQAVLNCLEQCLFSRPVWRQINLPSNKNEKSVLPPPLALTQFIYAQAEKNAAAAKIWSKGSSLKDLQSHMREQVFNGILEHLAASVLAKDLGQCLQNEQGGDWASSLSSRTIELAKLQDSESRTLDMISLVLLNACKGTLFLYASPNDKQLLTQAQLKNGGDGQTSCYVRFIQFLEEVTISAGVPHLIQPSRYWVVAELLCADAQGLSGGGLCEIIIEVLTESQSSITRHLDPIIHWLAGDRQEAPDFDAAGVRAAAISHLLKELDWKLTWNFSRSESAKIAARLLSSWLCESSSDSKNTAKPASLRDLREPLALLFHGPHFRNLAAHLRYGGNVELVKESGLTEYTTRCLQAALADHHYAASSESQAPPTLLGPVVDCFPVRLGKQSSCLATTAELKHLALLAKKLLAADPPAVTQTSVDIPEQSLEEDLEDFELAEGSSASEGDRSELEDAGLMQSGIFSAATTYCWGELDPITQKGILERVRLGCQEAVVRQEDTVEELSRAAVQAASLAAPSSESRSPAEAINILRLLTLESKLLSAEAAAKLEEATKDILALSRRQQKRQPSFRLEAAAAYLNKMHDVGLGLSKEGEYLVSDVFRSAFSLGAVEVAGQISSLKGCEEQTWRASEPTSLTMAVSDCCSCVISEQTLLKDATKAMDTWAEETGVGSIASCCGILRLYDSRRVEPLSGLICFALHTLLQPESLRSLVQEPADAEDEGLLERQTANEAVGQFGTSLIHAGVRPEFAAALSLPDDLEGDSDPPLLAWAVLLALLLELPANSEKRSRISQALHDSHRLVPDLLHCLVRYLPLMEAKQAIAAEQKKAKAGKIEPVSAAAAAAQARIEGKLPETLSWNLRESLLRLRSLNNEVLTPLLYRAALRALPASSRSWFQNLGSKKLASSIEAYTVKHESSFILGCDLAEAAGKGSRGTETDAGLVELGVRVNHATREIIASMDLQDAGTLELAIQLPPAWPLQDTKLECRKLMGIADSRLRRWMLSMTALLRSQNGAVLAAIDLWHSNCARQFEGVEECLICYSIIQSEGGQLPKLACKTCSKRYHNTCLYKWFRSSSKSVCPHCQSTW